MTKTGSFISKVYGPTEHTNSSRKRSFISTTIAQPNTRICHENGAFNSKTHFKPEQFQNAGFRFSVHWKHFEWSDVPLRCFSKHLMRFQSKNAVFKFLPRSVNGNFWTMIFHEVTLCVVIEELDRNKLRSGYLYVDIVNGIINLNVKHIEQKYRERNSLSTRVQLTDWRDQYAEKWNQWKLKHSPVGSES